MKKLILVLVAMISCQYSFGQSITIEEAFRGVEHFSASNLYDSWNDFKVTNKTEDVAYEAPNSALTKRWYSCPTGYFRSFGKGYVQFNPNGTLVQYEQFEHFHAVATGKWQRSKQNLKVTINYATTKCINDDLNGYSLREKDEINQERIKEQNRIRKLGVKSESRPIRRMDDVMVLDYAKGDTPYFLCAYLVSEDFLAKIVAERKVEEARQAKKAEEEKKKAEEEAAEVVKLGDNINKIYDEVEEMPSFPGGQTAMMQWFDKKLKYPIIAKENDVQGSVLCTFVIERDGSITDVRVVRGVDPSLDKEAVRLLKAMPHWIPGKQNGLKVRVKCTLPVEFKL